MSLLRRIARPLIAAPFIYEGVQSALHPNRVVEVLPYDMEELEKMAGQANLPVSFEQLLRVTGVIAAGAGTALAFNRFPRAAALTLLLTTSVGLAGRKRVWELEGAERMEEVRAILADLGLFGGALLAVVDTDGKPSLAYRVDKAIERGQKAAAQKQRELEKAAKSRTKKSSKALDELDRSLARKVKAL